MHESRSKIIFQFLISISLIIGSASFSILPESEKRPDGIVKLRDGRRNLESTEPLARQVADLIQSKNFSFIIEFQLEEQTRGTLISVYTGPNKILELYAEGMRGELIINWRRHSSVARVMIFRQFDDNRWHKILFAMEGSRVRVFIDCQLALTDNYPELDFSLLNAPNKPQVWIGQRNKQESFFQGSFRRFDFEPTVAMVRRLCGPTVARQNIIRHQQGSVQHDDTDVHLIPETTTRSVQASTNSDGRSIEELKNKVRTLERAFYDWVASAFPSSSVSDTSDSHASTPRSMLSTPALPETATDGVCPNCYEYLRYKVNHLEDEFKTWREKVRKLEKSMHRIMLAQRGCQMNSTTRVNDGFTWTSDNCTECVCHLAKIICKPKGCSQLPGSCSGQRPHLRPGQCCPDTCGRSCTYQNTTHVHGKIFWPQECLRCQCVDGDTYCAHRTDSCPKLNCPSEKQYKHENQCCPVCEDDNFCAKHPCHPNASCVNRKVDRECTCKLGFFGDGEQCFDVDECRWDPSVAEQLGGCGSGSRCINTPGSFRCECLPGYAKLNESQCLDMIIF